MPRMTALHMLRSTISSTVSAPANSSFRGSITHPTQPLCTLRVRRRRRLTQHLLPGGLLGLTWAGLTPADRTSFRLAHLHDHLVDREQLAEGAPMPSEMGFRSKRPGGPGTMKLITQLLHWWGRQNMRRSSECAITACKASSPVRPRSATSCELSTSIPGPSGLLPRRIVGPRFVFFLEQNSLSPLR
jgi:hypothetical protein